MSNGRILNRKFRAAAWSLGIVSLFAGYCLVMLCEAATDAALILGAWAGSDGVILKFYFDANLKDAQNE